jgi:PhoPQ-activated pathogenicity-related protein
MFERVHHIMRGCVDLLHVMKHASNIYSVHFTTLILLDFFFQMYASIPKIELKLKHQIIIIEMRKVIEKLYYIQ